MIKEKIKSLRKKLDLKKLLIGAGIALVAIGLMIGVAVFLVKFLQKAEESVSYAIEEDLYYYYHGYKYSFKKDLKLDFDDNGKTINADDPSQIFPANPLYYASSKKLLLPCQMAYVSIVDGANYCIDPLSIVEQTDAGPIYVKKDELSRQLVTGFLYDGSNIYVFLEPVTLKFNGYTFELGPLSYVEASSREGVTLYNTADHSMFTEDPTTQVTAYCATGNYTISLINGSMVLNDGVKRLLYNRPQDLEKYLK